MKRMECKYRVEIKKKLEQIISSHKILSYYDWWWIPRMPSPNLECSIQAIASFEFPMRVEPFASCLEQVRVPQLNAPLIIPLIYVDTTPYPKKWQALDSLSWRFQVKTGVSRKKTSVESSGLHIKHLNSFRVNVIYLFPP